jgi:hypothetical protein
MFSSTSSAVWWMRSHVAIAERPVAAAVQARAHRLATAPGRAPFLAAGVAARAAGERSFLELDPLFVAWVQDSSRSGLISTAKPFRR